MRGIRGKRKLIVTALVALGMVLSGIGMALIPVAPAKTNPTTPSGLRSGDAISAFDAMGGNDQLSNLQSKDKIQSKFAFNEDALAQNVQSAPGVLGYDKTTGRQWDQYGRETDMDDAFLPTEEAVLTLKAEPVPTGDDNPRPMVGDIDLGGPYEGFVEGQDVTFTATLSDMGLTRIRYDLNGDGKWDQCKLPDGTLRPYIQDKWHAADYPTDTCVFSFRDDFYGNARVEAWDGTSYYSQSYTGWGLGSPTPYWYMYYYITYWTLGHKFKALKTMTINQLRVYKYSSSIYYGNELTLWDVATQAKLPGPAQCNAPVGSAWRQCNLPVAVTLQAGKEYMISMKLGSGSYGYWYARGIDMPADTSYADWQGTYYAAFTPVPVYPSTFWSDQFIPLVDFYYSYTEQFELVDDSDTAFVDVRNVAPTVYDLTAAPDAILEGGEAEFAGMFYDPGLDDKWQFRWCYGDGNCDDWGSIKVGSGISRLDNILVYSDVAPHMFATALDFYGVSYTLNTNIYTILADINSRQWDIIIYSSYYIAYIAPTVEDALMTQIAGGALVLYNNWYANNRNTHPLLTYFGATTSASYTSPPTMYAWDSTHDVFNVPLETPLQFNPTHNQYWTDGFRLAMKSNAHAPLGYTTNVQTNQAAMAVRNDLTTIFNGFTPQNFQADSDTDGDQDMIELLVNELRLVTGPEIPPSMPWPVPPAKHVYRDDHPETVTPFDDFDATLEVKDDDHGRLMGGTVEFIENFNTGTPWPLGWTETEGWVWEKGVGYAPCSGQAALYWYYYDFSANYHTLRSRMYDLSMVDMSAPMQYVEMSFDHSWEASWPYALWQDGYVDISVDGGSNWQTLKEYHHMDPSSVDEHVTVDITSIAGGYSNVYLRLRIRGYDDYWWHVDNVRVYATWGTPIEGLGSASITVTVNNVEPTAKGVPTETEVGEALEFYFDGITIEDPTMYDPSGAWDPMPSESFMYRWNFDDGNISPWYNKGSLELPKLKVLVLHTLSFGTGDGFLAMVRGIDLVTQVDTVDYLYLAPSAIPTPAQMMAYDAVIVATNYATFSSTYDATRTAIGDYLATYVDNGGAVITFMFTYDLSPYYGDLFGLRGRYMDEDYGAYEWTQYSFTAAALGWKNPDCVVMDGVNRLTTTYVSPGDYPLTPGAILCAEWDNLSPAVAIKEVGPGRSVNIGALAGADPASVCGGDCNILLRNSIVWGSRSVVPDNIVPTEIHVYGDNGIYNVNLQIIDDDMGWDISGSEPVAIPGETQTISDNFMPIEVMNRDPTIDPASIQVYLAAKMCLRVTGKEWHTVYLDWYVDGTHNGGVMVTRQPGDPNDQAKCAFTRVDLLAPHTIYAELTFVPFPGTSGSNPTWLIIEPWRAPTTPGHGTIVYKEDFNAGDPPSTFVRTIDLGNLKRDLFDSGQGAPVDIEVTAGDPGTDDLAFFYEFSDGTGAKVNIHANKGGVLSGHVDYPMYLGFVEPFFDRLANDVRTPAGNMDFVAHDGVYHRFTGDSPFLWVFITVLDDDNSRGYDSPFGHDGTDMEFFVLDLT